MQYPSYIQGKSYSDVIRYVADHPGMTTRGLCEAIHGERIMARATAHKAITALEHEGIILRTPEVNPHGASRMLVFLSADIEE